MYSSIDFVLNKKVTKRLEYVLKVEFKLWGSECWLPNINSNDLLNTIDSVKLGQEPSTNIS